MKKFNFLALAFAAFAFVACSNENDPTEGNGGGQGSNGEKSWMSLSLKTTNETRSLNSPDKENGTANESNINLVLAIFFDGSKNFIETVTLQGPEMGLPAQDNSVAGAAFKVESTAKHMFIVANPSSAFSSRVSLLAPGTSTFADLNAALTSTVADVTGTNSFMMTNAHGDLAPYEKNGSTWQLGELSLSASASDAENTPVEVYLDRVVAKVRVINSHDNANTNNALVGQFNWVLNVTNKMFIPASERIKTYREANGLAGTPIWSDRYEQGSYRRDPNYDNTAPEDVSWEYGVSGSTYAGNFDVYTSTSSPSAWKNSGNEEYCLENTQEKRYNMHAYTTQVLLKAEFAPKNFQDVDGANVPNADPAVSYFKIGSGLYTFETLYTFLKKEIENKYTDQNPDTYSSVFTDAFNQYMRAISGSELTLPTKAEFAATPYDGDIPTLMTLIDAEYDTAKSEISANGSGTFGNFTFYAGGVNYYKIMIKHDDTDTVLNELGEFGVVRNSIYDVIVGSINSPGYPNIPDPDPDTEDEDDQQYLAIKINVNPWTWYTQTVNL